VNDLAKYSTTQSARSLCATAELFNGSRANCLDMLKMWANQKVASLFVPPCNSSAYVCMCGYVCRINRWIFGRR